MPAHQVDSICARRKFNPVARPSFDLAALIDEIENPPPPVKARKPRRRRPVRKPRKVRPVVARV